MARRSARWEKFRAYDSYADSFKDYAQLITNNKRYEKVLASAGDASTFAQGLQKAGYATDPNYAAKLTKIIKEFAGRLVRLHTLVQAARFAFAAAAVNTFDGNQ